MGEPIFLKGSGQSFLPRSQMPTTADLQCEEECRGAGALWHNLQCSELIILTHQEMASGLS
jgi:hypothetical protein